MAGFADLAARLGELADLPSRITSDVATDINALLEQEFDDEADPYGRAWAPLAESTIKRKGHSQILHETGALRAGTQALAMGGKGIEIVSLDYGQYHQSGTGTMPARKILPDGANELPKAWSAAIEARYRAAFGKVMKK